MVLQKKLYYGFNGFQAPAMPRGSRSARGKRSVRNTIKRDQMCAFELLATVAGKLLLEEESPSQINSAAGEFESPTGKSNDKQEKHDARTPKVEPCDQGSCDEGALPLETYHQRLSQKFALKECSQASNSVVLEPASVLKSETSGRNNYGLAIDASKGDTRDSLAIVRQGCSDQRQSPYSAESHVVKMEDGISALPQADLQRGGNGMDVIVSDLLCTEDSLELDSKPPTLVSSDSSVELPPYRDHISRCSSFPNYWDDMELIGRDDDENSSRCTLPSAITSKAFRPQRIGDRRIRKLLASKFWKVGPTLLNDGEFSNIEAETKSIFCSRKMCYTQQRTQRSSFKRRKLFQRSSTFTHTGEISNEFLSMSPEKSMKGEPSSPAATLHGGQKSQLKPDDYQVKFSIKSFKLPELFIEMSESATVGELKRTVLETMTAILRNGLRVGVMLQGKKVRDDSKTLFQTGISHGAKLDSLGFSLEPNSSQIPQLAVPEDPRHLLDPCDSHEPLSWLPAVPSVIEAQPDHTGPSVTTDLAESELNLVSSTKIILPEKTTGDSSALVAPAVSMEALAVVPVHRKSKRPELVQRRIRRPFSVTEVEALVYAVEKLGTGRWRDVKLRAFENAKHRTYVDLKDKWKTLVHTARISPQQRRGEPVPQELLDRVLSAHSYWSQQQAKLHIKQQPDQCLLL